MTRVGRRVWGLALGFGMTVAVAVAPPFPSAVGQAETAPQIRIDREVGASRSLKLEVGQNRLLVLSEQIVRVSVAEPRVADLKVITPNQLLLTAKGTGVTDLTLWNRKDEPLVLSLEVSRNLESLRKQLKELLPNEEIQATAAGDLVILSGEASDVRVPDRALEVAQLHGEKVANLIRVRGNQQVQLEVKFAEVSRTGLRQMSVNILHQDALGRFVGGMTGPNTAPSNVIPVPGTGAAGIPSLYGPNGRNALSVFFSGIPRFPLSAMVSLLESSGLAKILAEPTLVALSGQEAKFLAGGEFPIPFSTGLGQVSVSWKKFGIILNFTPTVIDQGTIHLKLGAEVSDVDPARGVTLGGFFVPGLSSRQSETTVRLGDGQSFAIAGLLSNRIRSQIDKIPLLGDLPVLGALFRSIDYRRDESELLVVVTAHLAKPLAPHEVPALPTEHEMNDPGDFELFLMGLEGRRPGPNASRSGATAPANDGRRAGKPRRGPAGEIGFI
ncbi:MAG TPA: type II and III secretion system protein family protein, partial [Polyangia bacterium]